MKAFSSSGVAPNAVRVILGSGVSQARPLVRQAVRRHRSNQRKTHHFHNLVSAESTTDKSMSEYEGVMNSMFRCGGRTYVGPAKGIRYASSSWV